MVIKHGIVYLFASEDVIAFALWGGQTASHCNNVDSQTCSSDSIAVFSCHTTAMCYVVHGNRSGHTVTVVQWSRRMHNPLGHNAPSD